MTVLEPMPERTGRRGWLRRAAFVASALALSLAFAVSLSAIASTEGTVRPDGRAAAIAARQATQGDAAADHRDCPNRGGRARGASRRV
jgi:hypothetical protein